MERARKRKYPAPVYIYEFLLSRRSTGGIGKGSTGKAENIKDSNLRLERIQGQPYPRVDIAI